MKLARPLRPFLGCPVVADLEALESEFAFLGVPYGAPYEMRGIHSPAADAAEAVREATHVFEYADQWDHWDFDVDGPLVPAGVRIVDCGDVVGNPFDLNTAPDTATAVVESIVGAGAVPLIVGGDDAIPPTVSRGLQHLGLVHVLHVDAHLDFREEVKGVPNGYSSPIRRLREQPWIGKIVQVGLRGVGSARRAEVEAARAAGNTLITARQVHDEGVGVALAQLEPTAPWFVTIDCDGLDPSIAPGVGYPEPDGLTFHEASSLVRALAREGRIAAIDVTEYRPAQDLRSLTAFTIIRLLMSVVSLCPPRPDPAETRHRERLLRELNDGSGVACTGLRRSKP